MKPELRNGQAIRFGKSVLKDLLSAFNEIDGRICILGNAAREENELETLREFLEHLAHVGAKHDEHALFLPLVTLEFEGTVKLGKFADVRTDLDKSFIHVKDEGPLD